MRPKTLNFEQLVKQNKQELLDDKKSISQIETRLEMKQMKLVQNKRKKA
ncbi:MAG: FbpB family small basic protein [Bacillota bacterium]|uniref:FbpB family small basic protein n=1 Tax=Virgibacillus salarius TaxID=447199 RepID=A0A941DVZ8_9BACI|nr:MULTISPECIES: FbpB family small basic protein [Bacillaceae]NAZ09160.1 FbpB family small basic protein [Agaribacter marinus]MBR7796451.1 FbpB family small basic protein [Virgibacillus salarius]MCC2251171.1 FbpB family small basic protein [Virgibacillus sp. AGTR]MDY7045333.1 FbpB family small basic protein [Virgibacillus sp. M23]QRZ16797.1 FbpB family small basic protein [Virgibacillus sp. AGTR]